MGKQWHGGKGDKPRGSNDSAYASGWELAFGKKTPEIKARRHQSKLALRCIVTRRMTIRGLY